MKNEVYPSSEVRPLQDKFNWAYLDIDNEANSQLADGFRVGSIPYIVFVNAEGTTVLNVQQGGSPPKEFAKELTRVLQRAERAKTAG